MFESAVNVLRTLPPGPATAGFAKTAAGAGRRAANSLGGQRHDLLGRVFHWILSTAAPTGAYYTSSAAATFLAGLAIRPEDAERFPDFTIVDPACGTGTLLMATARQLGYLNPEEAGGQVGGKALIEDVLRGYDIEAAAVQLAAVALGLMNPKVKFERMGIHHLKYGRDAGGTGVAGSLELMGKRAAVSLLSPMSEQVDTGEAVLEAERHDLVIMNPPFTSDSRRHKHLGKEVQKVVKDREEEIFKYEPVSREGSAGMFLLLAERLCEEECGTLATVLPTAAVGSPSASQVWEKLLKTFHLETVVTSHDPSRILFSENTGISESLAVLRRLNEDNRDKPTRFINLKSNPSEASDALRVVREINSGEMPGVEWPRKRVEANDWTPVKFLSPHLINATAKWFSDEELGCVPIGEVAEVGPAGRRTQDAYKRESPAVSAEGRWGLWFNNQQSATGNAPAKRTMAAQPDCSLMTKPGKTAMADDYWEQRGRLMLSVRISTTSVRLFAVRVGEPVLGSGWVPAKHRTLENPEDWEKAMCAYLNSTVGYLGVLWVVNPKKLVYPNLPLDDGMRAIPVPDFTEDQAARLARIFEEFADQELERFRNAEQDPVRKQLDASVCEVLGWELEEVEKARRALCREPSVTGRPAE